MYVLPQTGGVQHKQSTPASLPYHINVSFRYSVRAGVAGFRAAQGVEVVQGMRGILGGTQGLRETRYRDHFRWRFATQGHQEVRRGRR